jgi:predicted nuclease of predicted toxin-antitoxin system
VDARHTLDLPKGNASTEDQVMEWAEREGRIIVTKDSDFVQSHILRNRPTHLMWVSTGNLGNAALESKIERHWPSNQQAFTSCRFVELSPLGLTLHDGHKTTLHQRHVWMTARRKGGVVQTSFRPLRPCTPASMHA